MEKNKYFLCFLLFCLFLSPDIVAQESQTASLSVFHEEERTISVRLNGEQAIMGLQMEMSLPEGMVLADASSIELSSSLTGYSHRLLELTNGHYIVLIYNLGLEATTIRNGELFRCNFVLSPDMQVGEYPFTISDIKLAEDVFNAVSAVPYEGYFYYDESGATAIETVMKKHSSSAVYDLSGRACNELQRNRINIIDGKKILNTQ